LTSDARPHTIGEAMRAAPDRLPRFRDRLALGSTDLRVSPFCQGLTVDPKAIEAAFEAGINFFFVTADLHWPYYEPTRRGLQALLSRGPSTRDEIVVAVASYVAHPSFVDAALREVLQAIPALKRIDVLVVGGAREHDFVPRLQGAERLATAGRVRAIAATLHARRAALTAYNDRLVAAAFMRYNPAHPGARNDLFPAVAAASPTLLYNFNSTFGWPDDKAWQKLALDDEYWRPQITDYYRFALSRPELDGLLCALTTPAEVEALAAALELAPLSADEQQYLIDLAELAAGKATLEPARG
jgi:aryl-alcohol dehydrogenase-like predicted oxidoreductase